MKQNEKDSILLEVGFRLLIPLIVVYAFYVLLHGEYSPGGGFQAGVLLGVAVILPRLLKSGKRLLTGFQAIMLAGCGTFFYLLIGLIPMFFGGKFLQYGAMPFFADPVENHPLGILLIEVGVTICVMATVVSIFDSLGKKKEDDTI